MATANSTVTSTEEWRPVPGFEGQYEISSHARFRSVRTGHILSQWTHYRGHKRITLRANGKSRMVQTHRAMYEAFIGPIPDGWVVRHVNDVPGDNRLENLKVGTYQDNTNDMLSNRGHFLWSKKTCPRNHPLIEGNLVPGQLKRGYRSCLACDRARVESKRHPDRGSFEELADKRFIDLLRSEKVTDVVGMHWVLEKYERLRRSDVLT